MKAFLLLILTVIGVARAEDYNKLCPETGAVAVPFPTSCSKFLQCTDGIARELNCPDGKIFDDDKKICLPSDIAHCAIVPSESVPDYVLQICSSLALGQSIPAEDCEKYYVCYGNHAFQLSCPNGQHYSRAYTACMNPLNAGCRALNTMCVGKYANFTFPSLKCEQYFECNDFLMPELQACAPGLYFSVPQKKCTAPQLSGCVNENVSSPNITTPAPSSTTTESGCVTLPTPGANCTGLESGSFLPHKECNWYYMCFNSTALEFQCDCGQYYNNNLKYCIADTDKVCLK